MFLKMFLVTMLLLIIPAKNTYSDEDIPKYIIANFWYVTPVNVQGYIENYYFGCDIETGVVLGNYLLRSNDGEVWEKTISGLSTKTMFNRQTLQYYPPMSTNSVKISVSKVSNPGCPNCVSIYVVGFIDDGWHAMSRYFTNPGYPVEEGYIGIEHANNLEYQCQCLTGPYEQWTAGLGGTVTITEIPIAHDCWINFLGLSLMMNTDDFTIEDLSEALTCWLWEE